MEHITSSQHKCLAEVNGQTLLALLSDSLKMAGISDIAIVTGYRREDLIGFFNKEFFNPIWHETNMVCSLLCSNDWLTNSDCIVTYSDIFYGTKIVEDLINNSDDLAVAYDPSWLQLWSQRFADPLIDAETFKTDTNSFLVEIGQRPNSISEIQGQYMGLLKFTPTSWGKFRSMLDCVDSYVLKNMDMTSALNRYIRQNHGLIRTIPNCEPWGEVDQPSDLLYYNSLVRVSE